MKKVPRVDLVGSLSVKKQTKRSTPSGATRTTVYVAPRPSVSRRGGPDRVGAMV